MTLQQFRTISQNHRYRYLLVDGAYIGERSKEELHIMLFQLQSKYIEVFLNLNEEEILGSHSFSDTDELRPYLETIDLTSLF